MYPRLINSWPALLRARIMFVWAIALGAFFWPCGPPHLYSDLDRGRSGRAGSWAGGYIVAGVAGPRREGYLAAAEAVVVGTELVCEECPGAPAPPVISIPM